MSERETEQSLIERYRRGERSFTNLEMDDRTYDLSRANLAGADFSGSFIIANFNAANLAGARFTRANVKTCDFRGANLRGASFAEAAIDGAQFRGADLEGASFAGASEQGHIYSSNEQPDEKPA